MILIQSSFCNWTFLEEPFNFSSSAHRTLFPVFVRPVHKEYVFDALDHKVSVVSCFLWSAGSCLGREGSMFLPLNFWFNLPWDYHLITHSNLVMRLYLWLRLFTSKSHFISCVSQSFTTDKFNDMLCWWRYTNDSSMVGTWREVKCRFDLCRVAKWYKNLEEVIFHKYS